MSIRQFQASGLTYALFFDFRDSIGSLTSVDSPTVDIFTPFKDRYVEGDTLTTTSTEGRYRYNFLASSGITVGTWFALGVGITNGFTVFSQSVPFEIVDTAVEPYWVGLDELREYMDLEDDDHTGDGMLRQCLQSAIELVEGFTQRSYGIKSYTETIEIKNTDRVKLKRYPINQVTSLTAAYKITPRNTTNLLTETITGAAVSFYWRLDSDNGILHLTDNAGFDEVYDNYLLVIAYLAGHVTVPEPVRHAAMALAAALNNLACSSAFLKNSSALLSALSNSAVNSAFNLLILPCSSIIVACANPLSSLSLPAFIRFLLATSNRDSAFSIAS